MNVFTPRGRASSAPPNLLPQELSLNNNDNNNNNKNNTDATNNALLVAVDRGSSLAPRIVGHSSNCSIDGLIAGGRNNNNNNNYNKSSLGQLQVLGEESKNSAVNLPFHQFNSSSSSSSSSSSHANLAAVNNFRRDQSNEVPLHGILRHDLGGTSNNHNTFTNTNKNSNNSSTKNSRFNNLMIRVNSSSGRDSLETDYLGPLPSLKREDNVENVPPFMDSLLSFIGLGHLNMTKKNAYMKIEE